MSEVVIINLVQDTHVLTTSWPNPATTDVSMELSLAHEQDVRITLHDALGRELTSIRNGAFPIDRSVRISFSVNGLPAGTYHVRFQGERFTDSRAVVVVH